MKLAWPPLANAKSAPLLAGTAALATIGLLDCTTMQVLRGQFDAGRTLLWSVATLVPLMLAAAFIATRPSFKFTLPGALPLFAGATAAVLLLLLITDALVFPVENSADWLDRARSKWPGAAAFVGLGAAAQWLKSRNDQQKATAAAESLSLAERLAIRDARLAVAAGNYVELHCSDNRSRLIRVPLSRLANSPEGADLVRLHRSALVRASAIRRWHNDRSGLVAAELDDGTLVRIGRNYRRAAYDLRRSCSSSPTS